MKPKPGETPGKPRKPRKAAANVDTPPTPVQETPKKARAPKKPRADPAPKRERGGKIGAPSVWTTKLERAIERTLKTTGCSFRDAAEVNGISYETLRVRQQSGDEFSARIARVKLDRKTGALACVQKAIAAGDWRAAVWYLGAHWPEEYARNNREGFPIAPDASAPSQGSITNVSLTLVQQLVTDPARRAEIGELGEQLRRAAIADRDREALAVAAGPLRYEQSSGHRAANSGAAPQRDQPSRARGGRRQV